MNEKQLIELAKKGDKQALYDLLMAVEEFTYRFAYDQVRNQQDAEDVAQEALIRVCKNIQDFDGRSSITTWIGRIIINYCHDLRKKQDRFSFSKTEVIDIPHNRKGPEAFVMDKLAIEEFRRLLDEMEEIERKTLILRYINDYSYKFISEILQIPVGTVGSYINRARAKLHKHFLENKSKERELDHSNHLEKEAAHVQWQSYLLKWRELLNWNKYPNKEEGVDQK